MSEKTRESTAASELFGRLGKFLDTDLPGLRDRLKAVESSVDGMRGVDVRALVEELAQIRSAQQGIIDMVRRGSGALGGRTFHVPGLEDAPFSLMKAAKGILNGGRKQDFESVGAGEEFEALRAVQLRYADKYGDVFPALRKTQQIGDDQLGGAFVPDQLIADVVGAIYTASAFISLGSKGETRVTIVNGLTGGEIQVPKFDGGTVSTWIGEIDSGTETQANMALITMKPRKCGTYVPLTEDMIRMAAYGFDGLLRNDLAESVAKLVDRAIAYGKGGDHQPRGIVNHPGVKVFRAQDGEVFDTITDMLAESSPDWQGGELDFRKLSKMKLGLRRDEIEMNDSYACISSPDFFDRLKNSPLNSYSGQTSGQGWVLGMPLITGEQLSAAIGDWGDTTQIPYQNKPGASLGATTTSSELKFTDVFKGNMNTIVVGRWGGIEIASDDGKGSGFLQDITYLKVRQRLDMMIRQERELIVCPDARALDA